MKTIRKTIRKIVNKIFKIFDPRLNFSHDVKIKIDSLGTEHYGYLAIAPAHVNQDSVIYSFGAGEDVSWDVEIIEKYNVWIHAFDLTPRSIEWMQSQNLPDHFIFHQYGIGQSDEMETFFVPLKAQNVSYSVIPRGNEAVKAPVKRLVTIIRELKHDHIDILKMDIEGSEYKVIEDILQSHILPSQVLVEFHHRKMPNGAYKTARAIRLLKKAVYKIFYVSQSGDEFSFIHNTAIA